MYIQQSTDNNVSMHGWKDFKQSLFNKIPMKTIKDTEKKIANWYKYDNIISQPAPNRAIVGATALLTQPVIDYYNPRIDEETREISRNRTIAKIIIGTIVGIFAARWPSQIIVKKMTNLNGTKKISQALLPKKYIEEMRTNEKFLKNYRSSIATLIALFIMLFTNFLIDAPLTTILSNKLNERTKQNKTHKEVKNV